MTIFCRTTVVRAAMLGAILLMPAASVSAQTPGFLLPAQDGDLVVARALPLERAPGGATERAPVSFYQPLDAKAALHFDAPPFAAESREYWQRVDAAQLRQGFPLALTAPGAVVLLSPAVDAAPVRSEQIAILSGGEARAFAEAADTLVDASALNAAGMDARPGSVGFRLRDGIEGDAVLQVAGARGSYVLHVLEPRSDDVLGLSATRDVVHAGDAIGMTLSLAGGASVDSVVGLLLAPDGQSHDIDFDVRADAIVGRVAVPASIVAQPGLWDVRVTVAAVEAARAFQRDVRTAVAVVAPTARLDGSVDRHNRRGDGAQVLTFGIEVATSGRYELRGVLYGTDAAGRPVALGIAHAAAWLAPGQRSLALAYPIADRRDIGGPYMLRDLRLGDQSAIAVLERRDRAYTFD